jgi:L,D-peptidoglycan transpeptidase YkuD (ErfK/YbiS/YcfS/YnhG family)
LLQKVDILHAPGPPRHSRIFVRPLPMLPYYGPPRAILSVGLSSMRCAVGRKGIGVKRFEGDSVTPAGKYRIVDWRARFDRSPASHAECRRIVKSSGWCDDPRSPAYNLPVSLPLRFSAEALWRADHLYDLIGVINFNFRPRARGRGSAIFLHAADDDFSPTAGCVALPRSQLRKLKAVLSSKPQVFIGDKCWRRSPKIAEPTRIRVAPS